MIKSFNLILLSTFLLLLFPLLSQAQSPAAYQIGRAESVISAMDKRLAKEDWNTVSNLSYSQDNLKNLNTYIEQIKKKDPAYDVKAFQKKYNSCKKRIDSAGEGVANNYYYNKKRDEKAAAATALADSKKANAPPKTTTPAKTITPPEISLLVTLIITGNKSPLSA